MAVAACYGVLQLALLASGTRSVRVSTLLAVVAAGAYGCGAVALVLELTYTRAVSAATGQRLLQVVPTASYTVDPLFEELVKLLPLVLALLLVRRLRWQWGYADFLLIGAATGAGFALAEALLRYAGRASRASGDGDGGYLVPVGLNVTHIRSLGALVSHWLPAPVEVMSLFGDGQNLNFHLGWSALAALGVGFLVRHQGRRRWLGLMPLLYATVDHAAANRSIAQPGPGGLSWLLRTSDVLREALPGSVFLALVLATVCDLRTLRRAAAAQPQLRLAAERSGGLKTLQLARVAGVAPPWTAVLVWRLVLTRRAAWRQLATPGDGRPSALEEAVVAAVGQFDRAGRPELWSRWSWRAVSPGPSLGRSMRNPRALIWAVLVAPSVLFLVVGAVPALSGVQTLFAARPVFALLSVTTALGVAFLVWQGFGLVRQLPAALRRGSSDLVLRLTARVLASTGAVAAGAVLVSRSLRGAHGRDSVVTNFHILDALSLLSFAAGIALVLAAMFLFPPLGLVALAEGGVVLVTTAAAGEFALAATTGVALGGLGTLLSKAADASGDSVQSAGKGPPPESASRSRPKGVNLDPETRARVQAKLPPEWGEGRPTQKNVGTRWFGRKPSEDGVRVDQGDPASQYPTQRVDHVIVRHRGNVIGPDGAPASDRIKVAYKTHIPLRDWLTWRYWWKP